MSRLASNVHIKAAKGILPKHNSYFKLTSLGCERMKTTPESNQPQAGALLTFFRTHPLPSPSRKKHFL